MKNLKFNLVLLIFCTLISPPLNAQGHLDCPSPVTPAGFTGGTTAPFTPDWKNDPLSGQKTIPVVVHLIGTSAALQDNQIQAAINQLNIDFNSVDIDWDIEFRLAGIDEGGSCTSGITRHSNIQSSEPSTFKASTRWDNTKYLNIWIMPIIGTDPGAWGVVTVQPSHFQVVAGVIQRTDVVAGTSQPFDLADGVVVKEEIVYPNPWSVHTLAHEVGHWLNLLHTFAPCEGGLTGIWQCCHSIFEGTTNGDFIEDTPPQQNDYGQSDCSLISHYCSDGVPEDLSSFMGYAFTCQNKFTQGQREWMHHCLFNFRTFIYSEDNLKCTGANAQSDIVISQPTIWDLSTTPTGIVTIKNELRIQNGGNLTIAAGITVRFCEAARAIVEPGGIIQLFGTLTNRDCNGRMWQGVEVQGTPSSNQFSGIQGKIVARPGSVISNAVTGIRAGDSEISGPGLGGGIIQCTQATFSNNQRAVQFNPYENHLPIPSSPVTSNFSYFIQCEFVTDAQYLGDNIQFYPDESKFIRFYAFADLLGVRGIRFLGSNFINYRNDLILSNQYGIGIISKESTFSVGDYCTGNTLPCPSASQDHCFFKNLYRGIWATKTDIDSGLPHRYSVTNTTFEGCWTGIQSGQGSRCYIVSNYFYLGDIPTAAYLGDPFMTGLRMDYTHTNITVQENHFILDQDAPADIKDSHILFGTDIFYIGRENNAIRKNYFTDLSSGNQAFGEGANPFQTTGLHYLCNENTNNSFYDFDALGVNILIPPPGLREIQGLIDLSSGNKISAGNTFSHVDEPESDFSYTGANGIRYFHQLGILPETPLDFTPPPKVLVENDATGKQCQSILCERPPCKSGEQLAAEKLAIDPAKTQHNTIKASFLANPNGPNATMQKASMTALQEVIQGNTFDILTDIVANENGTLADYRYWLGNMDAYETDLELVRSYLGTGESALAVSKLSQLPSKYQLTGDLLSEFNSYQTLLNIIRQHYQSGGNKYNFPPSTISTFQIYAEQNPYARVRGLAKQLLAIYRILYPPELGNNGSAPRSEEIPTEQKTVLINGIRLTPNPADQSVILQFPEGWAKSSVDGRIVVYSVVGASLLEVQFNTADEVRRLETSKLNPGTYFVSIRLVTGESTVLPMVIYR